MGYWADIAKAAFWKSLLVFFDDPAKGIGLFFLGLLVTTLIVWKLRSKEAFVEHWKSNIAIPVVGGVCTWILVLAYQFVVGPINQQDDMKVRLAASETSARSAVLAQKGAEYREQRKDEQITETCKTIKPHVGIAENQNSLRRRTMRLADEYLKFVRERHDNHPAYPNMNDPNPTPEAQKTRATSNAYEQETLDQYNRLYKDRFIGIIRAYREKGIAVGWLENSAQNGNIMWVLPGGGWDGSPNDQLTEFRNLSYHVDAQDNLIVLTY